jgi:hypothetical protein
VKLKLLDGLLMCCSSQQCNGALQCEMFNNKLLDGYEHHEGEDLEKTREIFKAKQAQNKADGETVLAVTNAYDLVSW